MFTLSALHDRTGAAKMLSGLADALSVDASEVYVETMLSMLLTLPSPKHKTLYYYCLMMGMCKLMSSVPVALEAALNTLFKRMPALEPELSFRLAEWLAFHVSNFGFSLEPFGKTWGVVRLPRAKILETKASDLRPACVCAGDHPQARAKSQPRCPRRPGDGCSRPLREVSARAHGTT